MPMILSPPPSEPSDSEVGSSALNDNLNPAEALGIVASPGAVLVPIASSGGEVGKVLDSYFFNSADDKSFKAFSECLVKSGSTYPQVISLCANAPDISQKIAVVKAVRDSVAVRRGNSIIAYCECNGFEHATATALVACGADVSFAMNSRRGVISCVKSHLFKGVHCGRLMQAAGSAMGGSGGGHENAGGCSGAPSRTRRGLVAAMELIS